MAAPKHRMPIESGCPDGFQYMHPAMVRTSVSWNSTMTHSRVCCDIGESGDVVYTIRVGTQRILDLFTLLALRHRRPVR